MNIYGYHYKNIRPLSGSYKDDSSISITSHRAPTVEGFDSYYMEALSGAKDFSYNNENQFWLTEQKSQSQFLTQEHTEQTYPKYITTYLKTSGVDTFLVATSAGTCAMSGVSASINNNYYFELEMVDQINCYVRRFDSNVLKYLTVSPETSAKLTFTERTALTATAADNNIRWDRQRLQYVLDEENGFITLFMDLSTHAVSSVPLLIETQELSGTDLSASNLPSTTTWMNTGNRFSIIPKSVVTPETFSTGSSWVKYASSASPNVNDVDTTDTLSTVRNNFLLHTSTNDLNYTNFQLNCKLMPLKTLLTPTGNTSKTNLYHTQEGVNTFRHYGKIFTGHSQENGYDSIYLNYESGVKEIQFPCDKLTYFRAPQILSPYKKFNINDSLIHKAGAIAGDTPIKSDKLFKQLRGSKNNIQSVTLPDNTELQGTWLCSWLSGSPNPNVDPIWVDRYYNPDFYTHASALTAGILTPITYVDNFTYTTQTVGATADHITIFDKYSDLTIEPGILYAYYHSGPGNSQKIIDNLSTDLCVKDLVSHRTNVNGENRIEYDYDGPTHTMSNGKLHTGYKHTPGSIEVPKLYDFTTNSYGKTDNISVNGSFTLTFWMHCTDWSKPFGNQIIGNYITDGFGIYNKDYITPLIYIPDGKTVTVYNTDLIYVNTYDLEKTINNFVKKGNLENFFIIDDSNKIREYTLNGVLKSVYESSHLNSVTVADFDVRGTKLYILIAPTALGASYVEYDMSDKSSTNQGTVKTVNIWNYATSTTSNSAAHIHAVGTGPYSTAGVVVTVSDGLSARTTDTHNISGSISRSSTSFTDNSGNPWTIQNNKVYTYDTSSASIITALSSDHIIESIQCDTSNNIWVLHSHNKVTKLDHLRNELFTLALTGVSGTSTDTIYYNRYLDFVTEFDSTGEHVENCITINQSTSGAKFVKISSDGNTTTDVACVSGNTTTASPISFYNMHMQKCKTVTGHSYNRAHARDDSQDIKVKLKTTRPYNTTTTTETYDEYTVSHNVSAFKPGWNHFAVTVDCEGGSLDLRINTHLVGSTTLPQGAFSKSEILYDPLIVGTTPFHTVNYLSEFADQYSNHMCRNIKIKGLSLYKKPLTFYDIKAHYDIYNNIQSVDWTLPIGQRSYIDTVERVFNCSIPGRKSELFNINIRNTKLTDTNILTDLETIIASKLPSIIPSYTKANVIKWDGSALSAVSAEASNMSTAIDSLSTVQFTGDVNTQGGDYYY